MDGRSAPARGPLHDALAGFLGEWTATGTSFGGPDQATGAPRANGLPWTSSHTARWHTGDFFLIQSERARVGGAPFDTLSILGVEDAAQGLCFVRSVENHGFYRHDRMRRDGAAWTLSGRTERATIVVSEDGRRQDVRREWRPRRAWSPLCDRVAIRVG